MGLQSWRGCQLLSCDALHERNAPARRFRFILGKQVRGAMGQAETAFDAEVGLV